MKWRWVGVLAFAAVVLGTTGFVLYHRNSVAASVPTPVSNNPAPAATTPVATPAATAPATGAPAATSSATTAPAATASATAQPAAAANASESVPPPAVKPAVPPVQTAAKTGLKSIIFTPPSQSSYDSFAKCLARKQITMYGAYWCPHCAEQKEKFGQAFKDLKYVECAIPGQAPSVQTPACRDMQIRKYPTWVFPDGERIEAIQTLEQLSEKSGCKLP